MNRVFVDMDGVIVDFDAYKTTHGLTGDEVKRKPGAYLAMPPIAGAKEAVRSLIGMGFEVWIATKPPTGVPYAYSDKAAWIFEHLPELKRRIIITHDKGILGDAGDFLCDDRPHKANCVSFAGEVLAFIDGYHWPQALEYLRTKRSNAKAQRSELPCGATQGATGSAAGWSENGMDNTPEKRCCDECGHTGTDGRSTSESYCGACGATVPYPEKDICQSCGATDCMLVACPKCGGRYSLDEEQSDAIHAA